MYSQRLASTFAGTTNVLEAAASTLAVTASTLADPASTLAVTASTLAVRVTVASILAALCNKNMSIALWEKFLRAYSQISASDRVYSQIFASLLEQIREFLRAEK